MRAGERTFDMLRLLDMTLMLPLAFVACSRDASQSVDGGADLSPLEVGPECPAVDQVQAVRLAEAVTASAAGDLDGDGRMDLVVAVAGGGARAYRATGCGILEPGPKALSGDTLS